MTGKQMELGRALRHGRVVWYDPSRGYGFVHEHDKADPIFVTRKTLDASGLTGLHEGLEVVFDVVKGRASEKVRSIALAQANTAFH